jgi:hypothetical protein
MHTVGALSYDFPGKEAPFRAFNSRFVHAATNAFSFSPLLFIALVSLWFRFGFALVSLWFRFGFALVSLWAGIVPPGWGEDYQM